MATRSYREYTHYCVLICIFCFAACSPIIMSLKNIFLSTSLILLLLTSHFTDIKKTITTFPCVNISIILFLCIGIGILYSPCTWNRSISILIKYRRLLYPIVLLPLFFKYASMRKAFAYGVYACPYIIFVVMLLVKYDCITPKMMEKQLLLYAFPFIHPIHGSFIIAIIGYLTLRQLFKKDSIYLRYVVGLSFILSSTIILFFQQQRIGYVLYIFLIACAFIECIQKKSYRYYGFGLIALLLFFLWLNPPTHYFKTKWLYAYTEANYALSNNPYKYTSVGERIHLIKEGLKLFFEKPFFGHGTGSFGQLFIDRGMIYLGHEANSGSPIANPHNQFIFIAVEHGLLGLCLFLYWLYSLFKEGLAQKNHYLVTSLLVAFCLGCYVDSLLFLSVTGDFFIVLICWAITQTNYTRLISKS